MRTRYEATHRGSKNTDTRQVLVSRWRGRLWPRANEPVAVHQLQCAIGLRRRSSRGEFWAQWATTGILCIGIQRRPSFLLWEPAAWPIGARTTRFIVR